MVEWSETIGYSADRCGFEPLIDQPETGYICQPAVNGYLSRIREEEGSKRRDALRLSVAMTRRLLGYSKLFFRLLPKHAILLSTGWSGGAMVLGKLPVPGRPTIWIIERQRPIVLAVGVGGRCVDMFTLLYLFSLSLGDGPI